MHGSHAGVGPGACSRPGRSGSEDVGEVGHDQRGARLPGRVVPGPLARRLLGPGAGAGGPGRWVVVLPGRRGPGHAGRRAGPGGGRGGSVGWMKSIVHSMVQSRTNAV